MAVYESKKPTKDGRKYFFRIKYKDIFGEVHDYTSPKFKNKKDATNEEALKRIELNQNKNITTNITIDNAFNEYYLKKSKEIKKQSLVKIKNLYMHLESIKDVKINNINIAVYKRFRNELESLNFTSLYLNKIQGLFKSLIEYSCKYYNTNDSIIKFIEPFKNVNEIKKEMKFYTYDEYTQFRNVIPNIEWKTWFDVLYFLGLRCGECQALQFKDIDFNKKTLSINKTLTTKIKGEEWTISSPKTKNSIRILPIPKNVLEELKTLHNNAKKYKDYSDNWFIFGNSVPFKENNIQLKKNKYCDLAKVKRIRIHDFRHSCASLLINNGASIMLVSKYLGHSNISVTLNTYTHMYKSELETITSLLNNL